MAATDTEWKVIHFEDEEPMTPVCQLPTDGRATCLKILAPHSAIKKYTTEKKSDEGEVTTVLENAKSHLMCSIFMFYNDPEPGHWAPLMRFKAVWDELPARDGFYTFYALDPVSPLWSGSVYYHNLEFYDADAKEYDDDIIYYSDTFQL